MNIKLQTNERLSATVADGLAGVFVNGVSLSASLSGKADLTALQNYYAKSETSSSSQISNELKKYQLSGNYLSANALANYYKKSETSSANQISTALENAGGKVYFDNRVSGVAGRNDLSVVRLSAAEYAQMLEDGECLSNAIYIVEAPNIDAFKQQIKNVAPPTDLSDAVNKEYLENHLGYALSVVDGVLSSGSYVYDVNDRTMTTIGINQSTTPVIVRLPDAGNGARDFILRIEISSSAAPTFTFTNTTGLDFESEDDDWAVMQPGVNLVSFTETKR